MPQYTSRVVLNRKAFDEIALAEVDGLMAVAERVLEVVRPPDAPPRGEGLTQGGGAIGYLGRKKVSGTTIGGRQVKKPRALILNEGQAAVAVGFGFPARFVELGTVNAHARPFLTPAVMEVVGSDAEVIISKAIQKRLAGIRSK